MTIHIFGGGTFSHVRNHLALAAPAFGTTANKIYNLVLAERINEFSAGKYDTFTEAEDAVQMHLTKMADSYSDLVTNEDVEHKLDELIADPTTRVIYFNVALCDYKGSIYEDIPFDEFSGEVVTTPSGKYEPRLKTSDGFQEMYLTPAAKLIGKIRRERKDIFVVGFKTTCGATSDEQYAIALNMLKANSINLVLANDTKTRNNMIVAPEETRYCETTDRSVVLRKLVEMTESRSRNTFTRSTVVPGDHVPWNSNEIPDNLRKVVEYCIDKGAYKPFRGATAGHFAVKVNDREVLTSKRKHDYNNLCEDGLVRIKYDGLDKVIAHGFKPSVGGQSQRIIFDEHPDLDCIVHFHCPLRADRWDKIAIASQWQNECGSHQCGKNTSDHLTDMYAGIKAVMLDDHGPNIVFSRDTDPLAVIAFIEDNFDLEQKTGGLINA